MPSIAAIEQTKVVHLQQLQTRFYIDCCYHTEGITADFNAFKRMFL